MELDEPRKMRLPSDEAGELDLDTDLDATSDESDEQQREVERKRKLHQECIEAFKASADFFAEQRGWEAIWRKFYRAIEAEDQWDPVVLSARQGFTVGDSNERKGERPCLTMNEIKLPVQQTINEARQARLSLHVKPEKGQASREEAQTRQGILRGIQFHSNANAARLWALENAAIVGRGFYRAYKEYASDGDDDIDLRLGLILHQENVYPDPSATQLDLSDAVDGQIVDDLSHQEFRRRFPNAPEPTLSEAQGNALGDYKANWVGAKTYRISERYYVVQKFKIIYRDADGFWHAIKDEPLEGSVDTPAIRLFEADAVDSEEKILKLLPEGHDRYRKVPVRTVKYCLFTASDLLEEGEWEGDYIPIFQTVGRVHVVEGKVYFKGMVADGLPAQQLINYAISSLAEQVGIGTRAPWLVDHQQIEDWKSWWENANTENYPFLPFKRYDDDGKDLGVPIRRTDEPPILATLQTFQQARELLKATTGRFGASLGDISPDRSGKAINALKVQGELSSSDLLDNLANIAMPHEGRVLNGMLYPVYGYEGRRAKVFETEDDHDGKDILINQPFRRGDDGRPMPMQPPGMMQRAAGAVMNGMRRMVGASPDGPKPMEGMEVHRLTPGGQYETIVTVGKSAANQREEDVMLLNGILEAVPDPKFAQVVIPILVKRLDGPAAQELADALSPKGPQGEDIPPQLQGLIQDLKAQLEAASAAAQQAMEQLKSKQMDLALEREIKMTDIQAKAAIEAQRLRVEMLKLETQQAGKLSEAELKIRLEELKGEQRKLELLLKHEHEEQLQATEIAAELVQQKTEIAAEDRQQDRQLDAQAEQQERNAQLSEQTRQNSVKDARVDSAIERANQPKETK
jgi:hypothetical protein